MRAALAREFRFDPISLALRLCALLLAYGLLARAIGDHGLPAPLVALPMAAEILAVMWLGVWLARRVVDCPDFVRDARGLFAPLFWSMLLGLPALAWLAFDPALGELDVARIPAAAREAMDQSLHAGLPLAIAAMLAAIGASTWRDVRRWRHAGGVFVWTATLGGGLRLVLAGLLAVPLVLLLVLLGPMAELWLPRMPEDPAVLLAWATFAGLLVLELGALALALAIRRFLARYPDGPPPGHS